MDLILADSVVSVVLLSGDSSFVQGAAVIQALPTNAFPTQYGMPVFSILSIPTVAQSILTQEQKRRVSPYIRTQLPAYIRESESLFVEFVEAYYKWLETEGNTLERISNLLSYKNVDESIADYFQYLRDTYMVRIPKEILSDQTLIIKNIRDFYQSRGSQQSYKFFLRALSGKDASIAFPKERIMKVSGGFWYVEKSMFVSANDPNINSILSTRIIGRTSGATAVVNNVIVFNSGPFRVAQINIESQIGEFLSDEIIETPDKAIKIRAQIFSVVNQFEIQNKGSGYRRGTNIPLFESGDGIDFVAQIKEVDDDGGIVDIEIINRGVGYNNAPVADLVSINFDPPVTSEKLARVVFKTGAIFTPGGIYLDDRSLISSTSVIQDNKKFQEYSYTIKSTLALADYKEYVLKLLHPSGMYLSAEVNIDSLDENGGNPFDARVDFAQDYINLIIEPRLLDILDRLGDRVLGDLFDRTIRSINQRMLFPQPELVRIIGTVERRIEHSDIHPIADYDLQRSDVFDDLTFQQYNNKYGRMIDELGDGTILFPYYIE